MSCFTRRKDAPISLITQEVLRGLGALCQEPGTKTKDTFLIVSQVTNHSDLLLENSLLLSHLLLLGKASCRIVSYYGEVQMAKNCSRLLANSQRGAKTLSPTAWKQLLESAWKQTVSPCQTLSESSSLSLSQEKKVRFGRG